MAVGRSTVVIGRGWKYLSAHGILSTEPAVIGRVVRAELSAGERRQDEHGSGNSRVDEVTWVYTGPRAGDAALVSGLHEQLSTRWPGPMFVHRDPESFLARAVATRALLAGPFRSNLRSGPLAHPVVTRKARRQALTAAAVSIAAGVLLCAVNLAVQVLLDRREADMDRAFSSLRDGLMGHNRLEAKGQRAIQTVRLKIEKDKEELQPFLNAVGPSLLDSMLSIVQIGKKNQLRYEVFTVSRDNVAMDGTADRWAGCDELVSFLKGLGFSVKLNRKEALADGRIPFDIQCGAGDG